MKILCLHGRGSNNEIFQMQTAGFRSLLDDYHFEFIEGRMPHTEGNYSLYTTEFATSKLWGYMNVFDLEDVLSAEQEIFDIVDEEGPFDGILGYSQGAALASQVLIRDALRNPYALPTERAFRFAIFFNGPTPADVFKISGDTEDCSLDSMPDAKHLFELMNVNSQNRAMLRPSTLPDGRKFMTDGRLGIKKYDSHWDGHVIGIPTLHVRSPEDWKDYGEELYKLCDPKMAKQYLHSHRHDFPRGHGEMKAIAKLVRETAESSL